MSDSQQQAKCSTQKRLYPAATATTVSFVAPLILQYGLGVKFTLDGDLCRGEFTPLPQHMGYRNVTHGGIVFSLLDDVMANWLWLQGLQCFTARADIRYRSELMVGTPVRLEGWCEKRKGRLAQMQGRVIRIEDEFVVAEAVKYIEMRLW